VISDMHFQHKIGLFVEYDPNVKTHAQVKNFIICCMATKLCKLHD